MKLKEENIQILDWIVGWLLLWYGMGLYGNLKGKKYA